MADPELRTIVDLACASAEKWEAFEGSDGDAEAWNAWAEVDVAFHAAVAAEVERRRVASEQDPLGEPGTPRQ